MSQILQIHLGSAGVQIGDQSWDLSCEQFKVGLDGQAKDIDDDRQIVFNEVKENSFRPRAVFADMEQTPISEVMKGPRKGIYSKNIFEYGKESGCTYANGYFYKGREILDKIVDKIRQQAEKCNHLDGIIYHTCLSGGTGSGLGDDLLSKLEVDYPKIPKIPVLVVPSPNYSQLILEPYNAILAISTIYQYQNLCICVDNESLYRNCETQDIELPNYQNINQLIAMITNNLIVGNCGNRSYSLQKLVTNLMIQPKIQFVYPSLSYYNVEKSITTQLKENTMLSYHKQDGIVISRAIFYRGDFSLNCIQNQQNQYLQGDQVNQGGRLVGMSENKMIQSQHKMKQGAFMLQNNLSIIGLLESISQKFDSLFNRRAYVFWYCGDGQEESCFHEARYQLSVLLDSYKQIQQEFQQN